MDEYNRNFACALEINEKHRRLKDGLGGGGPSSESDISELASSIFNSMEGIEMGTLMKEQISQEIRQEMDSVEGGDSKVYSSDSKVHGSDSEVHGSSSEAHTIVVSPRRTRSGRVR